MCPSCRQAHPHNRVRSYQPADGGERQRSREVSCFVNAHDPSAGEGFLRSAFDNVCPQGAYPIGSAICFTVDSPRKSLELLHFAGMIPSLVLPPLFGRRWNRELWLKLCRVGEAVVVERPPTHHHRLVNDSGNCAERCTHRVYRHGPVTKHKGKQVEMVTIFLEECSTRAFRGTSPLANPRSKRRSELLCPHELRLLERAIL